MTAADGTPPRILVSAYDEPADWSYWRSVRAVLIPQAYCEAVIRAGGTPYVAPVGIAADEEAAVHALAPFDGVVLAGGADLDATLYGAERHAHAMEPQVQRDATEMLLLRAALQRGLPILAVCRGMQLLNVAFGGTLHQHLADVHDGERHRGVPGTYVRHRVDLAPGSRIEGLLGASVEVVSSHHQGLERLGRGLIASGTDDGLVEAIELDGDGFAVGVQWHPEEDLGGAGQPLFDELVRRARP